MGRIGQMGHEEAVDEVVVELGETNLWASVRTRAGRDVTPVLVPGAAPGQFPASLRVTATGQRVWGARSVKKPTDVLVTGFLSRVDDAVPVVVGSERVPAAELVARQVVALHGVLGLPAPTPIRLVHPVDLSRRGRAAVDAELSRRLPAGTRVAWTSRADAAVLAVPDCHELAPGEHVGLLHLGGVSTEASVWRRTDDGGAVGAAHVDRGHAGHALDEALATAVLTASVRPGTAASTGLNGSALDRGKLARLREECAQAKAALSTDTAVDLHLDDGPVRLTRSEVHEQSRALITQQLDVLAAALAHRVPEGRTPRLILIHGGGAAAPAVIEEASARFDVPVLAVPRVGQALPNALAAAGSADAAVVLAAEPVVDEPGIAEEDWDDEVADDPPVVPAAPGRARRVRTLRPVALPRALAGRLPRGTRVGPALLAPAAAAAVALGLAVPALSHVLGAQDAQGAAVAALAPGAGGLLAPDAAEPAAALPGSDLLNPTAPPLPQVAASGPGTSSPRRASAGKSSSSDQKDAAPHTTSTAPASSSSSSSTSSSASKAPSSSTKPSSSPSATKAASSPAPAPASQSSAPPQSGSSGTGSGSQGSSTPAPNSGGTAPSGGSSAPPASTGSSAPAPQTTPAEPPPPAPSDPGTGGDTGGDTGGGTLGGGSSDGGGSVVTEQAVPNPDPVTTGP